MLVKTFSCALQGIEAIIIRVEVHTTKGHRQLISGNPDTTIKESLARIESAIRNTGLFIPNAKAVFNLSPADIKKTGAAFDLAMAVALLGAYEQIPPTANLNEYLMAGELSLDGSILGIKGALSVAMLAWQEGFKGVLIPTENAVEAAMVTKVPVYPVGSLGDVVDFFRGAKKLEPVIVNTRSNFYAAQYDFDNDMSDVKGQEYVKRALEVAAAGGHNTLLIGSPGSGKSMIAKRLPSILPPLTLQESLETTRIYSVCGQMSDHRHCLVSRRPFKSPHHTISNVGLVGGGSFPLPGIISLAHNGVLFLDELPEFSRNALEVMRQPIEDGKVTISRAMRTIEFPASFMLVASMNPCPCGYFNCPGRNCSCSGFSIQKYLNKISGPLLDRIDLHIEVKPVPSYQLSEQLPLESSADIRERVIRARKIQTDRFEGSPAVHCNAQMTSTLIKSHCALTQEATALLTLSMDRLKLSGRAHDRIIRVARTIADLANSEHIALEHLTESIGYRSLDRESWMACAEDKNPGRKYKKTGRSEAF